MNDKLKNVTDFSKKHWVSLTFGLISLLAIVAVYWPIGSWYADLQAQLDKGVALGTDLIRIYNTPRTLPLISPDQTEPAKLSRFPSQAVIDYAMQKTTQLTQQANSMNEAAQRFNQAQHTLLVPDSLPHPTDLAIYNFASTYSQQTAGYLRWKQQLNLGHPPTPDEIQQALLKKKFYVYSEEGVTLNPDGSVPNSADATSKTNAENEYQAEAVSVRPTLVTDAANTCSIYVLPLALPVDPSITIEHTALLNAERIWDAQLALWIVDDAVSAISRINHDYTDLGSDGKPQYDVMHTPIKRIFSMTPPQRVVSTTPTDATAGVTTPVPSAYFVSPTGRVSNGLYEVERYRLELVVDASKLPQILQGLEANQFLTVMNVQVVQVVDPASAAVDGFLYGTKPVVLVDIDCEELMMRDWINNFEPPSRRAVTPGNQ